MEHEVAIEAWEAAMAHAEAIINLHKERVALAGADTEAKMRACLGLAIVWAYAHESSPMVMDGMLEIARMMRAKE